MGAHVHRDLIMATHIRFLALAILAGGLPLTSTAQFVKNIDVSGTVGVVIGTLNTGSHREAATSFTTGSNQAGYTLDNIN